MRVSIKNWAMIAYLFVLIFAPPMLPFNSIYILFLIAVIFLFNKGKIFTFRITNITAIIIIWCFYVIFNIFFNELLSNGELLLNRITVIYQIFILIPMQIICAMFVNKYCAQRGLGFDGLVDLCILAGLVESVLVVISFFVPSIRSVFIDLMINLGGKSVYTKELISYRAYGFADTLLDTFGYGMGILAGVCLLKDKIKIKYIISCILFLFSTAINSRTGLAIFVIFVIIKFFIIARNLVIVKNKKISKDQAFQILFITVSVVILLTVGVNTLSITNLTQTTTYKWIIAGFKSIYNFLTKTESSYQLGSMQNSLLSKNFWNMPESIWGLLFGLGHSCYGKASRILIGVSSDVGYVNYIWICGFIGLITMIVVLILIFRKQILKTNIAYEKQVLFGLLISFLIMFIKGNVISHTAGTVITILIIVKTYFSDNYAEG